MVGGVLYEHGHRMVAAFVGLLVVALYLWAWLGRQRRSVMVLAACALATVVLQGLLGGLTVLMKLPPPVSVAHACLAQAFLCLTVAVAALSGPGWRRMTPLYEERSAAVSVRTLAVATFAAVYGQLVLGAVMRHTHAGLAIPDFPLAFGRIVPPLTSPEIAIHFSHRVWALVVTSLALWLALRVSRTYRAEPRLHRPTMLLLALLTGQLLLGAFTIWTAKSVVPTTTHVLVGAMVLATSFLVALRTFRLVRREGAAESRSAVTRRAAA
jgi:cytochrome c oxidase assembly protein subunit 15